jgi:hypothetical protein
MVPRRPAVHCVESRPVPAGRSGPQDASSILIQRYRCRRRGRYVYCLQARSVVKTPMINGGDSGSWIERRVTSSGGIQLVAVSHGHEAVSFAEAVRMWRADQDAFRLYFIDLLADCPFHCFRFETPPITAGALGRPFEFVLVDSPEIDLPADPRDFQSHFDARADDVLVFDNLGGDATMIVPRPREGVPGYAHIAGFTRQAPQAQQLLLWKTVGETLHRMLGDAPLWLNTAGGGVPWLHVRLDSRPKYYVYGPYRSRMG